MVSLRQSTLETLGLGGVLDIFRRGAPPASAADLVDEIFGPPSQRRAMLITGANGLIGAGKTIQLSARLEPYGIPVVALDLPSASAGLSRQYPKLAAAVGTVKAERTLANIIQLAYDGVHLPPTLTAYHPRVLLEAIPENLELKKQHYQVLRTAFPDLEIRSTTSGFPSHLLSVAIAHPAFPPEVNKVWEIVEPAPSPFTQLLWALGLIPVPVGDQYSFVLDVLFCGLTLAALKYHERSNMPFWKLDQQLQRLLGPNPFRAHDAIGPKAANYLTWSCLRDLHQQYGELFRPTPSLEERKDSGQQWYPLKHLRPVVGWSLDTAARDELQDCILGPIYQMVSLILHERRSQLAQVNAIGELCAQFRPGVLARIRADGSEKVCQTVAAYHKLYPEVLGASWYPHVFERMDLPEWQQLYVNAEHDGVAGVISISRESYSWDVDTELNRAIEWLHAQGIRRVVISGDFHLATQMIGADVAEFLPALEDAQKGMEVSRRWSRTARRLHDEFETSVGLIHGKRCLGGYLELLIHCHYLIAVETAEVGFPEVTLPVVPGMEACHWLFRRAEPKHWPRLFASLLEGQPVRACEALGWLVDYAGPLSEAIKESWALARGKSSLVCRKIVAMPLDRLPTDLPNRQPPSSASVEAARRAIAEAIRASCAVGLEEALEIQARHAGQFMTTTHFREGRVGARLRAGMVG